MLSYCNCELINIKNRMKEWLELNKALKKEKVNFTEFAFIMSLAHIGSL